METLEPSALLEEISNGTAILENSIEALKELTMKLVLPRSLTPRFICQNRKQMFTQKLVYKYS